MESVNSLKLLVTDSFLLIYTVNYHLKDCKFPFDLLPFAVVMFFERFAIIVPSVVVLSGLGALSAQEAVDPVLSYLASVIGSFAGAAVWYSGGRGLGTMKTLRRTSWLVPKLPLAWKHVLANGSPMLAYATILAQCVPTVRLLAPMAAGISKMSWLHQAPLVLIRCAIWNGIFFWLGYQLGALL